MPLSATTATQRIDHSRHEFRSLTQRDKPIAPAVAQIVGNAIIDGSQPIAVAPSITNDRSGSGSASTGNGVHPRCRSYGAYRAMLAPIRCTSVSGNGGLQRL